jgi:copper(I)-binding protein
VTAAVPSDTLCRDADVLVRAGGEHTVIRSRRGLLSLRDLVVVAAMGLIPAIAGCEAGIGAPTQEWHQPTPGASAVVDNTLRINNMFVLGPTPGFTLRRGASAGLYFALSNDGAPDRLIRLTAPGSAASVHVPAGGITLGREQTVFLTGPEPRVVLQGLTRVLNGGQWVRVNLEFQNAGYVSLRVPVMPRTDFYGTYSPAPLFLRPHATPTPLAPSTPSPTPTS